MGTSDRQNYVFQCVLAACIAPVGGRAEVEVAKIGPDLPQEPNSFVGRERELDELRKLLSTARMVTLSGPGGIGKTRLAVRVLAAMADEYVDGVWFVDLADLNHPDLVVPRVATAVGVTEEHGRPLADTLADALRPRRMLLALDTCEHLADACARLCRRLLASSPDLRLLATSREPLRVAGEAVWPVPPLSVPLPGSPDLPSDSEAVRLFTERTVAAHPGFALSRENAQKIGELCRALDGMPLAIELAAARMRALSLDQITARLADRFALLTTGDRAAPPRQRTLRAAIDWSHGLLSPAEQVLLRRLSVFAAWSLEMAELVCTDDPETPAMEGTAAPVVRADGTLDLLAALVDKSLVVREAEALGQARYRMLDTIREYAAVKLAEAGETAVFSRRLRDWVLSAVERNFAIGMGLAPASWADRVDVFRRWDVDAGNVWRTLGQCLADADAETGMRVCTAVRPVWLARGMYGQGSRWTDAFLALPAEADVPARVRGAALIGHAQLLVSTDPAAAGPLAEAGLALSRGAADTYWMATGLNVLSEIAIHTGRADQAEACATEALQIARVAGDAWGEGYSLGILATVAGLRGATGEASELGGASISVMRSIDHAWGAARAQLGLADLARLQGDHAGARQRYLEALATLRQIDSRPEISRCLSGLGRVALSLGDTALARDHLTEAIQLSRTTGSRIGVARSLEAFAALAVAEDDPAHAVLLTAAATALRAASGLPPLPGARAERYLAPARRLGDQVVARLWPQGLALTAEDAITLAVRPAAREPGTSPAGDAVPGATGLPGARQAGAAPIGSLTRREREIVALVAQGHSNKAIARELFISPATVARHIANIMRKLGFHSRTQIAAWTTDR